MENNRPISTRQQQILQYINDNGGAQIRDFIGMLEVSEATIRRDIDELAGLGLVARVHGGAVSVKSTTFERVHSEKLTLMHSEKLRIAKQAASIVKDGNSIFLDSGTTAYFIACELSYRKDLTIITNNLDIAHSVRFDPSVLVIVTGGILREEYGVMMGHIAEEIIGSFCVDIAFMGCDAIDATKGVYNTNVMEVGVKQQIAHCGKKTILVTDSSKFHVKALEKVCALRDLDMIITDSRLDRTLFQQIDKSGLEIVCV